MSLLLAGVTTFVVLWQLFAGADAGVADNGDGPRLMCSRSLVAVEDTRFRQPVFEYRRATDGECSTGPEFRYVSSATLPLAVADLAPGGGPGFDLRTMGVLLALMLGSSVAALHRCLPGGPGFRLLASSLVAVVATDIAYTAYFSAPYSEGFAVVMTLLTVSSLASLLRRRRPTSRHLWSVALCVGLLATAKLQLAPLALLAVPALIARPRRGCRGPWSSRVEGLLAATAMLVVVTVVASAQGASYNAVNKHNLVFDTVLPQSSDPTEELAALGLPPEAATFIGTSAFAMLPDGSRAWAVSGAEDVSRAAVLRQVVDEPDRAVTMLRAGVSAVGRSRPDNLATSDGGGSAERRLAPASALLAGVEASAGWWGFIAFWVLAALRGLALLIGRSDREGVTYGALCVLLSLAASSVVLTSLVGDGYFELVKHVLLAGLLTSIMAALLLAWTAKGLAGLTRRRGRPN